MKTNYAKMNLDELSSEESELRTALFNLRLQNTTKELENTSRMKYARRELARLITFMREQQRKPQSS